MPGTVLACSKPKEIPALPLCTCSHNHTHTRRERERLGKPAWSETLINVSSHLWKDHESEKVTWGPAHIGRLKGNSRNLRLRKERMERWGQRERAVKPPFRRGRGACTAEQKTHPSLRQGESTVWDASRREQKARVSLKLCTPILSWANTLCSVRTNVSTSNFYPSPSFALARAQGVAFLPQTFLIIFSYMQSKLSAISLQLRASTHTHTDTHTQTHRHTHTDMHTYTHPYTDTYSIVKGREWPVTLFWLQPLLLAFLASPHGSAPQNLLTRAIVCLLKEKQRRPWKVIEQSGDCRGQCCEEGVLLLLLSRFSHVWLCATP